MTRNIIITMAVIIALCSCGKKSPNNTKTMDTTTKESIPTSSALYMLVGTYTAKDSKGIYVYKFDTETGESEPVSMTEVTDPSYLAISKDEKFVYSVTESDKNTDAANAFSFDKQSGKLTLINSQPTDGKAPCYLTIDRENKHVITANYNGGSITVFNVNEDGSLAPQKELHKFEGKGVDKDRQTQPHLHCVHFSPDEQYLFADDLGTDKIHRFKVNKMDNGSYLQAMNPESVKITDGEGPRHLEFHPNGKWAYLITEMGGKIFAFNYKDGDLKEFQSIVADTLQAKGSADIHITPDGRFLYASNRLKGDGLTIFSINQDNGTLTRLSNQTTGAHPRNFIITPNGKYLLVACRDSDKIQVFEINKETGFLVDTKKDVKLSMPVCIKFASL